MASQTFDEAMKNSQPMSVTAPDGKTYAGFYADPKVDRATLSPGWHCYDIRHDDDGCGIFCQLCHNYVLVNNAGTFMTQTAIPELSSDGSSVDFAIDEEEWNELHEDEDCECPEKSDTDWGYSF